MSKKRTKERVMRLLHHGAANGEIRVPEHVGLKCDTPKCGWKDLTITVSDAIENWNDAKCPQCKQGPILNADELILLKLAAMNPRLTDEPPDGMVRLNLDTGVLR